MQSEKDMNALHLHLGGESGLKEANGVFKILSEVCGDVVRHNKLTKSELINRGYDPNFITQVSIILYYSGFYIEVNLPFQTTKISEVILSYIELL